MEARPGGKTSREPSKGDCGEHDVFTALNVNANRTAVDEVTEKLILAQRSCSYLVVLAVQQEVQRDEVVVVSRRLHVEDEAVDAVLH